MSLRRKRGRKSTIVNARNVTGNSNGGDFPRDVIHIILSSLSDAKERAQKALISKSWLFAWNTYPYLIFNQADIIPSLNLYTPHDIFQRNLDTYTSLVNGAISKYEQLSNNGTAKQFRVQLQMYDLKLKDCMDSWIQIALYHRVEDITLAIHHMDKLYYEQRKTLFYIIPREVFSNKFIQTLNLLGGPSMRLPFSSSDSGVKIDLSGLRCLSLSVPMDVGMLKNLIRGCPLLEKLMIHVPNNIKRLHLSGLRHLKEVEVTRTSDMILQHCIVDAPMLETFALNLGDAPNYEWRLNMDSCQNFIFLGPHVWNFCSWFSVVCLTYENIKEGVYNDSCQELLMPDLASSKFSSFLHKLNLNDSYILPPTLPHLQLIVQDSFGQCRANIKLHTHKHVSCFHWFDCLMQFLNGSKSYAFKVLSVSAFFTGELVRILSCEHLSGPTCNIKQLNLYVKDIFYRRYSSLLNLVFTAVHPEKLYVFPESDTSFLKSLCKQFSKENIFNCGCCYKRLICWHRYLDDASFSSPDGFEEFGPVNENTLYIFKKDRRPICFRLKWRLHAR